MISVIMPVYILFGLRARGDARENSDWDILIRLIGKGSVPFSVSGVGSAI